MLTPAVPTCVTAVVILVAVVALVVGGVSYTGAKQQLLEIEQCRSIAAQQQLYKLQSTATTPTTNSDDICHGCCSQRLLNAVNKQ
jgi:type II secretory pathway pseudopilin PulG